MPVTDGASCTVPEALYCWPLPRLRFWAVSSTSHLMVAWFRSGLFATQTRSVHWPENASPLFLTV